MAGNKLDYLAFGVLFLSLSAPASNLFAQDESVDFDEVYQEGLECILNQGPNQFHPDRFFDEIIDSSKLNLSEQVITQALEGDEWESLRSLDQSFVLSTQQRIAGYSVWRDKSGVGEDGENRPFAIERGYAPALYSSVDDPAYATLIRELCENNPVWSDSKLRSQLPEEATDCVDAAFQDTRPLAFYFGDSEELPFEMRQDALAGTSPSVLGACLNPADPQSIAKNLVENQQLARLYRVLGRSPPPPEQFYGSRNPAWCSTAFAHPDNQAFYLSFYKDNEESIQKAAEAIFAQADSFSSSEPPEPISDLIEEINKKYRDL